MRPGKAPAFRRPRSPLGPGRHSRRSPRYEAGSATPALATLERLLTACGRSLVLETKVWIPRTQAREGRLAFVRRSRQRLLKAARRHGIRDLRVFGLVAREEETAGSDIDLLVELEPRRTLIDLIGFQQEAEDILGLRVYAADPRFMKDRVWARAVRDARRV